jgi:streptogrisin C
MTLTIVTSACLSDAATAASLRPPRPEGSDAVLKAMARDLHIDEAAARRRLAAENEAARTEAAVVPTLGRTYAGSWFDPGSGKLVVNLTDATMAAAVRRGGALPRILPNGHGLTELNAIKTELDELAESEPSAVAGVRSWGVDPVTGRVVVTTLAGRERGKLAKRALAHGGAVRFETTTAPAVATEWADGGEGIQSGNTPCSLGFNARLTYSDLPGVSDPVIISAGHCATAAEAYGFGNARYEEPTKTSTILGRWWLVNRDHDWGVIGSIRTDYWSQGPWISLHTPFDGVLIVHGTQQRPIGSSICKSGFRTGITCGVIRNRGESVYQTDQHRTVYNLTRDTTCTRPGDSGGPRYTADGEAQGITSTSAPVSPTDDRCLQDIGQENRSWYVEITYIQGYTGARVTTG